MARKYVPITANFPYHITARTINKDWFQIPLSEVWEIMSNYLHFLHHSYSIQIFSFVLMPNHFHLLARSPETNLSEAMNYFLRETSRQITFRANRINQTYGNRYHRSQIATALYFRHAYKYVYRNPVKAGLCGRPENFPYSTLCGLLGTSKLLIPVHEDKLLFAGNSLNEATLEWLNKCPSPGSDSDVKKALRHQIFILPKDKNTKRESPLATNEF